MTVVATSNKFIQKFILWIFPTILTVLGTLIYSEISGVRGDIKSLLASQSATIEQVAGIDARITRLEDRVFPTSKGDYTKNFPITPKPAPVHLFADLVFVTPNNSYRQKLSRYL